MYGVGPFGTDVNSSLYRIDLSSGAATLIGDTGFERLGGLAASPAGVLYGYTPGALYTIDTTSGAATRSRAAGRQLARGRARVSSNDRGALRRLQHAF